MDLDASAAPRLFTSGAEITQFNTNSAEEPKVLWLAGLPGGYEMNQWSSEDIIAAQTQFSNELQDMDVMDNPKPHYLDDGDIFRHATFSHPDDIASFSAYDKIYIACHGDTDITGYDSWGPIRVLNGKWKLDGIAYDSFAFYLYSNVKMVYGCNPTDGFIGTQTLVNKFKDPTKNYLYE